jgi:nucleoid-associated protein YgaU
MKLPLVAPAMRRHRVTDGDSLERLAERYLGSPERAAEIFDANRDVLTAADLLPLGRIIRIPPREEPDQLEPAKM